MTKRILVREIRPMKEIVKDLKKRLGPQGSKRLDKFLENLKSKNPFGQSLGPTKQCLSVSDITNYFHCKTAKKKQKKRVIKHLKQCAVCRERKAVAEKMHSRYLKYLKNKPR